MSKPRIVQGMSGKRMSERKQLRKWFLVEAKRVEPVSQVNPLPEVDPSPPSSGRILKSHLPPVNDHLKFTPLGRQERLFDCGHRSATKGAFNFYGEVALLDAGTAMDRCGDCELKHIRAQCARCALCRRIIWPGNPVVLYLFTEESFSKDTIQEWFSYVDRGEKGRFVIGCLRLPCNESGACFHGHWDGGFQPLLPDNPSAVIQA